jgi:hypothetical protein
MYINYFWWHVQFFHDGLQWKKWVTLWDGSNFDIPFMPTVSPGHFSFRRSLFRPRRCHCHCYRCFYFFQCHSCRYRDYWIDWSIDWTVFPRTQMTFVHGNQMKVGIFRDWPARISCNEFGLIWFRLWFLSRVKSCLWTFSLSADQRPRLWSSRRQSRNRQESRHY